MQETKVRSLGWEDPLEKRMATHSCILAWRIPWTEEPGGLQSMGLQRVRHDWVMWLTLKIKGLLCSEIWLPFLLPHSSSRRHYPEGPGHSVWAHISLESHQAPRPKLYHGISGPSCLPGIPTMVSPTKAAPLHPPVLLPSRSPSRFPSLCLWEVRGTWLGLGHG